MTKNSVWFLVAVILMAGAWLFFRGLGRVEVSHLQPSLTVRGHRIVLELADRPETRSRGLGGHAPLSDDEGMLFSFQAPEVQTFWMKDMTFPIDIVWLAGPDAGHLRIAGYEENADPQIGAKDYELKLYRSPEQVSYVLEVRGGLMRSLGAVPGDGVDFNILLR